MLKRNQIKVDKIMKNRFISNVQQASTLIRRGLLHFLFVKPPGKANPSGFVISLVYLSQNRMSMVATCARVAVPCGTSVDSVKPLMIPAPQANCMAGMAYSLIWAKSA